MGTSSSRYVAKNYWRDPKSGVDYQVQVQVPTQRMNRPQQVETLPLQRVNPDTNLMVRDVATVQTGTAPGEIDRSAMQRYLSITANIEGDDLGPGDQPHRAGHRRRRRAAARRARQRPRPGHADDADVRLAYRRPGLVGVVILVLLTGFFQSFRLGLISIGAVPGVVCGVAIILLATGTTLNIESFMGSIMCIGVSVSNSVLLSTFMDDHWRAGAPVRQGRRRRGPRPLAADPDDRRRHGAGHDAHGAGPGRGQRNDGPAGTGRDRRTGGLDLRHAADRAGHVRPGDGRLEKGLALDRSRRSFQPASTIPASTSREAIHGGPRPRRISNLLPEIITDAEFTSD